MKQSAFRNIPTPTIQQYQDLKFSPRPRYYVEVNEVSQRLDDKSSQKWFIAFRGITLAVNERTAIAAILPFSGVGNSAAIILTELEPKSLQACLLVNICSFTFDYLVRQKMSGANLNFFIVKQIPVLPPFVYVPALQKFILSRVLELTYTSWDLQPFAQDVGYRGNPFIWEEQRRLLMRCELDALYFHLYGLNREEANFILDPADLYGESFPGETFHVFKEKEIAKYGEYLTKRIILEMYDQMAALPTMHVPAPKDESVTYAVPDVSQWATWLNPPPADASMAHSARK